MCYIQEVGLATNSGYLAFCNAYDFLNKLFIIFLNVMIFDIIIMPMWQIFYLLKVVKKPLKRYIITE